ncbi:GntR family transcriptional regulator [Ilyomonas limi]|uniref:GntR family transcriptional regulator n=1 Tax=Ilyomonas limi TaxID=2575867 RepID=A0A4U3L9U9_9BACT|nr:GntR family transcriptional regulator [Ilyomonas limi]TKK71862.1 GntR family transcriptional regulator [Ilyomonas limi]
MEEAFVIDHRSALPLHLQVEEILRKLIEQPEYQNGKLLPNEVHIAQRLGISRNTVRQATNKLVYEQLLVRKKGVGTKVAKNNIATKLNKWTSFTHEMDEKGVSFKNYAIKVSKVLPDKEIRQLFNIAEGVKVVKLERLRGLEKGPIVYFISYFHPRTELTEDEDYTKPLYEKLEQEHHIAVAISKEGISAILANKKLADKLNIAVGDPILFRKRVVCDPGDRPIEYNLGYYRADSFTYTIDIARD